MRQEMEDLVQHFIDVVDNFAKEKDRKVKVIKQYGRKRNDGYKCISSVMDFENFKVRFAYQVDEGPVFKKGIITLYINIKDYEYHFCDILAHINPKDKDCVVFPYIDNNEIMDKCLKVLFLKLDTYENNIMKIVSDEDKIKRIQDALKRDIKAFSGKELPKEGPLTLMISGIYSNTSLIRYTSDAYKAYLNGNYKKSIKLYSKEGTLVLYEKQLVKLMKRMVKKKEVVSLPEEQKTINRKDKIRKETLIYTIISSLIVFPIMFLLTYILYTMFLKVIQNNAQLLIPPSIIFLFVPSIALTIAFTKLARDKIFKDKVANAVRFNALYTHRQNRKKVWVNAITIASILVIAIIASSSITLRQDGVKYSKDILDFTGTIVSYNDIQGLDRATKEIMLKNGEAINLETYSYDLDLLEEILMKKIK